MKIGGSIRFIHLTFGERLWNNFESCLLFPCIAFERLNEHWSGELYSSYKLEAKTEVNFIKSDVHWYFGISILGFGFFIKRQWDY